MRTRNTILSEITAGELTMIEGILELDKLAEQGNWIPACGGTEVPFFTRSGDRVLYCWQPRTGKHAYLDLGTDIIIPDENLAAYGLAGY